MRQIELLTARRKATMFTGGENTNGQELGAQPVTIGGPARRTPEEDDLWRIYTIGGKEHTVDGCDLSPHPLDPLDNKEFVGMMLDLSSTALMHPFILTAIEFYAKTVLAASKEELGGDGAFINPDAWRSTAQEALGWMVARQAADEIRRKAPTG
jgi:hypothetical protein